MEKAGPQKDLGEDFGKKRRIFCFNATLEEKESESSPIEQKGL